MPGNPWANNEQLAFLTSKVDGFQSAQRDGTTAKFLKATCAEFFEQWPDEESDEKGTRNQPKTKRKNKVILHQAPKEPLTHTQWKANRKVQIRNWFNNRGSGTQRTSQPTIVIGEEKANRTPSEVQLYSKKFYATKVQPIVEKVTVTESVAKHELLPLITRTTYQAWLKESPEVRQAISTEAKLLKEEAKKTKTTPKNTQKRTPEEYANELVKLPNMLKAFLLEMSKRTGYVFTIMAGGPDPSKPGMMRTYFMHEGTDLQGQKYSVAYDAFYQRVVEPFLEFVKGSFTVDDINEYLPPDSKISSFPVESGSMSSSPASGPCPSAHDSHTVAEKDKNMSAKDLESDEGHASAQPQVPEHPPFDPFDPNDPMFALLDDLNLKEMGSEPWSSMDWGAYGAHLQSGAQMEEMYSSQPGEMSAFANFNSNPSHILPTTNPFSTNSSSSHTPLAFNLGTAQTPQPNGQQMSTAGPFIANSNASHIPPGFNTANGNASATLPEPNQSNNTLVSNGTDKQQNHDVLTESQNPSQPPLSATISTTLPATTDNQATSVTSASQAQNVLTINGSITNQKAQEIPPPAKDRNNHFPHSKNAGAHQNENVDIGSRENRERATRNRKPTTSKELASSTSWLESTRDYLTKDIGDERWLECIRLWYDFEKKEASEQDTTSLRITTTGRPDAVKKWMSLRKYNSIPSIANLEKFAAEWLVWWNNIQPKWRRADTENTLPMPYDAAKPDDNLHCVRKGGPSGIMSVLVGLMWWAKLGDNEMAVSWNAAVEDVLKCFTFQPPTKGTKGKRNHEGDDGPKKRVSKKKKTSK